MKISIIIGFRNREISRVRQCLESLNEQNSGDFEVVFVDYGSKSEVASQVRSVCDSFAFVKYFYNDTRGMVWNRSHALNSGASLAEGDFLLLSDIDLVYSSSYVNQLRKVAAEGRVFYNRVVLLDKEQVPTSKYNEAVHELSSTSARGIIFIAKSQFERLGGLDEFYSIWGIEDNDFYLRCREIGLKDDWLSYQLHPVFHLWHPPFSVDLAHEIPEKWMDEMIYYYLTHQGEIVRNRGEQGKIFNASERITWQAVDKNEGFEKEIVVPSEGLMPTRSYIYREIFKGLKSLRSDQLIKIRIPRYRVPANNGVKGWVFKFLTQVLKVVSPNREVVEKRLIDRENHFIPELDIRFFVWKLIINSGLVKDYSFVQRGEEIFFILSRR